MFQARLPARKFRKYVCTGAAAVESRARNESIANSSDDDSEKGGKHGTVETIERVWGNEKGVADVTEAAITKL